MTPQPVDAVSSFAFLLESIPKWKEQVEALIAHTTQKQEEFRAEYTRLVYQARPRKAKSGSVCSLHTFGDPIDGEGTNTSQESPQPPNPVDISPLVAGNRFLYAQANKKRKPGTSFRSGASGPVKFRSRQAVVIYYDSWVQEQFGALVKSFSACRNNLRKGKMAYTVSKGLQLPTLRRGVDRGSASPSLDSIGSSTISRQSTRLRTTKEESTLPKPALTNETAFVLSDQELEKCQNLCETAAHQFLRDGDCNVELSSVMKHIESVVDLAQVTHDSLKLEVENADKVQDTASNGTSTHTTSGSTLVEKPSTDFGLVPKVSPLWANENIATKQSTFSALISAPPPTTEIEVDDDSNASSIEIDINNYRLNNAARHRT